MGEVRVRLEQVEKTFAGANRPALSGISAEIKPGIITGLVGPDGAGKTTLLRLMAGLLLPSAGQIRFEEGDAETDGPAKSSTTEGRGENSGEGLGRANQGPGGTSGEDVRARQEPRPTDGSEREWVGYMPQKFGLYEDLSVLENLELHADLRGVLGPERGEAFQRLLAFTDLARFTKRLAGKLSGGMKQKLGLACALLGRPKLLLLDEPSVGVDPISRRELWKMVHELIAQGLTVVWSTAYLDEAELCRQVLLLNEGRLLFAGKPGDLTAGLGRRCWQIRNAEGSRRELLSRALRRPEIMDGVIQGHAVRLVLRADAAPPDLSALNAGPQAQVVPAPPRFEDGFIDVLGGGPGGDSALAQRFQESSGGPAKVVEATDLTKRFGAFTAADRISFQVTRGEVFGLLGPNGAGKSTTFRMLCGLLRPSSGTARVMGIDLKRSPSQARQRLGYMAQKFSLYGNLTVRQNLDFFSGVYGLRGSRRREVVGGMVEAFKLEPFLPITPETLPLGFKQRLALACAVMHQPDVLFLDEPTSGVDPVTRREFWAHINGLVEKGVTVIVTTHFMDEAEYCDRIALVFRGRVIAAGTPDQLKEQARTADNNDPSMEDAFVNLVQKQESTND